MLKDFFDIKEWLDVFKKIFILLMLFIIFFFLDKKISSNYFIPETICLDGYLYTIVIDEKNNETHFEIVYDKQINNFIKCYY